MLMIFKPLHNIYCICTHMYLHYFSKVFSFSLSSLLSDFHKLTLKPYNFVYQKVCIKADLYLPAHTVGLRRISCWCVRPVELGSKSRVYALRIRKCAKTCKQHGNREPKATTAADFATKKAAGI